MCVGCIQVAYLLLFSESSAEVAIEAVKAAKNMAQLYHMI